TASADSALADATDSGAAKAGTAQGGTDEAAATWEDAGEFSADDAPSTSGTSEGSDLSTPNLDTGTRTRRSGKSSGTS
ncbi:MAG: hypothetical protein ACRCZP_07500, partial [Phycicoccus sp.]